VSACASAFTAPGPDALSDYELLEMVLFSAGGAPQ
jgi:DNA repair protein RadC